MVRLPLRFIVLLFMLKVPPVTTTFVGASVLPVLLVHVPRVLISMSPPMVVFVPDTLTAEEVDTLLPPLVAVFPVKVILGLVPSNNKLAPPTKNAAAVTCCRVVCQIGGGYGGRDRLNVNSTAIPRSGHVI